MVDELRKTLLHWWQHRPYKEAEHVFTMLDDTFALNHNPGDPFTCRQHLMKRLCKRAGVKPFGFHAIRHLSAVILCKAGKPASMIQKILRHQHVSTTEKYLASLGFEQEEMREASEVLGRGPAKVIPLPQKNETS